MSLSALLLAASAAQIPSPQTDFGPVVKWSTVAQGFNCALQQPEWRVLSSEAEWRRMFTRMFGLTAQEAREAPRVADWQREMAVVVAAGTKPTPGHAVYVQTISRRQTGFWEIEVVHQQPPRGAAMPAVISSPWVIIRVERTVGTPRVVSRNTTTSATIIPGDPYFGCRPNGQVPVWMVGQGGRLIPMNDAAGRKTGGG